MPSQQLTLSDAIAQFIKPGMHVALEGFTHLIPQAAGHEIIRQNIGELTLYRMTPDIIYDQMIGMGLVKKLVFSWGGNPGVGSLHRLREAIEKKWPQPLEIDERSHADMACAYVAGASRLPFGVLRSENSSELPQHNSAYATIQCPFTGEALTAVKAIRPDVTIIHAQQADRLGNVCLWGITGVQKEAVLAAENSLVTVEEIVEKFEPPPGALVLPHWVISAVVNVPGGAYPSYAQGYSQRDNTFYQDWDAISRERTAFQAWMKKHILREQR